MKDVQITKQEAIEILASILRQYDSYSWLDLVEEYVELDEDDEPVAFPSVETFLLSIGLTKEELPQI